jgi:hypothetical protein
MGKRKDITVEKKKNTLLEARESLSLQNCDGIGLSSGCNAEAVHNFEETVIDDTPSSIKKRLGDIKISFTMKNTLRKAVLKNRFPDNSPHQNSPHGQLCPIDNSPHGQLATWTTRHVDNSPRGQLATWTTCPMDNSPH